MPRFGLDRLRSLAPMGTAHPPIAIDFGARALKALQLTPGQSPAVLAVATIQTPDELLGDPIKRLLHQCAAIPGLLKAAPFKGRRVVCSLPTAQTFCKHLQLTLPEDSPAAGLIASAVAEQLKCTPGSLLCRHVVVGPAAGSAAGSPNGKSEIIGLAAPRVVILKIMQAIKAAHFEPVGIYPEPVALLRSFDHITRRAEDSELTSLYLDLGCVGTRVIIAHGKNLVFAKTITLGGHFLDQTIARQSHCSLAEAHAVRLGLKTLTPQRSAAKPDATSSGLAILHAGERLAAREASASGAPSDSADGPTATATAVLIDRRTGQAPRGFAALPDAPAKNAVDLREPLDTLTDEVSLCLRYHESLFPTRRVNRTIFVGGEARHVGLCQHVARALRLPAHVADPLSQFGKLASSAVTPGIDLTQPQPGWAVAAGLCLSPTDL